jgi:hypothetical protein
MPVVREVSAYIDATAHRAGYGRALYSALFDLLTAQGFERLRRHHAAQSGECRVPQSDGIRGDRCVPGDRLQVRRWHDVTCSTGPGTRLDLVEPPRLAEVLATRPLR